MQPDLVVPVAYRAPFDFHAKPWVEQRKPGSTVLEIVRSCPVLPANFERDGYVCINGEVVPRHMWGMVTPKPSRREVPVAVTMHTALQSPGSGGGATAKSIGALVGAIALTIVTGGIATGALIPAALEGTVAGLGFLGLTGAQVLAGAVGIAGALALSALTAPPTSAAGVDAGGLNTDQAESAAASGNTIDRGGAIPRVIGTRKVFPPFACEPVIELVDQDEIVEALYILNGPHDLSDIRIDGSPLAEAEDVEFETREGWPGDMQQTMVQRQGRTLTPNIELSVTSVQGDGLNLQHQSLPESDLPVWHGVSSRNSPDEIWLHLLWPGGINNTASPTSFANVPLRIRFRKHGDINWINCPEIHIQYNSTNQLRTAIKFIWSAADPIVEPPANNGFYYAIFDVPPQTSSPGTPADRVWTADSYFNDGSGNNYLFNGNAASTKIKNLNLYENRVEIFLDENVIPKGLYEIQIKRGDFYFGSVFTKTTYAYAGPGGTTQWDFFWYRLNGSSAQSIQGRTNLSDRVLLTRSISIWNEQPLPTPGQFAVIALKALNRSIRQLSVSASGYVQDWDGSGWNTWTTTSNPAPHYRDVLSGSLNLDPLPDDLRDDDALVAWRTLCATNDWTCDSIVNDTRTQDVLSLLASCGYARPYQSDVYGVIVDNDRSLDAPVQVFSRRNSANFRFEKAFARLPAGFNVTYRDESLDDDQAQTTVYLRDPTNADVTQLEAVSYDGLISLDKVTARAQFDLDQAVLRSTFYHMDVDVESIVCRRGSLVAVEHDVMLNRSGDGYIVSVQRNAGSPIQITGITLDSEIPITNEPDMHAVTDMHAVADMHLVGVVTGVAIRHTDGSITTHALSNVTGSTNVLTFATPFTDDGTIQGFTDNNRKYGCLVVSGDIGSVYKRLLIQSITPNDNLTASMVLVDEAPDLVRFSP